jgi:AraC-like DNA-binding protein
MGRFPYLVFRYRCKSCRRVFSSSFFELGYWDKKDDLYEEIFDLHNKGFSKRATAEFLKCSEETVRRKLKKMTRQTLLRCARDLRQVKVKEPIAYDGIENFSFSQFDPNNVNHAVGKETFFVYDFNFAPLNRKGRMSPRQKKKKRRLEEIHGKYPTNAIESSTRRVFKRLLEKASGPLVLHTDNHYAYQRAIRSLRGKENIAHFITPGKVARNYRSRLFPINHLDMLTRHETASFKRETIAFSKHSIAMMENFILYVGKKNYMRPIFLTKHRRDPLIHKESPAMRLGLTNKILSFRQMFKTRITEKQAGLNEDWERFFRRLDPTSRRPIQAYRGI